MSPAARSRRRRQPCSNSLMRGMRVTAGPRMLQGPCFDRQITESGSDLTVSCCPGQGFVPCSRNREGGVSMSDPGPVIDVDAEADQLAIQAVPGAVFLRLRREREDGSFRRMFVEM